jgi:hypothetical protein
MRMHFATRNMNKVTSSIHHGKEMMMTLMMRKMTNLTMIMMMLPLPMTTKMANANHEKQPPKQKPN